jgi:hypothetical protein
MIELLGERNERKGLRMKGEMPVAVLYPVQPVYVRQAI